MGDQFLKIKILNFTKLVPQNSLEKHGKNIFSEKSKFHPNLLTELLNYILIGLHQFIEVIWNFCIYCVLLIMKVREEVKLLLQEKLQDSSKKKLGSKDILYLEILVKRDWGHARLCKCNGGTTKKPDDFVVATSSFSVDSLLK